MFATPNSPGADRRLKPLRRKQVNPSRPRARVSRLIGLAAGICGCASLFAADPGQPAPGLAQVTAETIARAKTNYLAARSRFQADTNNAEAAWQYGRACFDVAESATNNTERAKVAEEGIAVARRFLTRKPDRVQTHYFLGMNLGQLADTKRNMAALRIVDEMEREFEAARKLDEHFDYAGSDRNLGLLYFEAPSLLSIGSRSKARQHLQRAVELAPDYPGNRLVLIEAYQKWGDRNDALRELKALAGLWSAARKELSGPERALDWIEWEKHFRAAKKKLGDDAKDVQLPPEPH